MAVSYNNKMIYSLQQLAGRCLDVIELVQAAEPRCLHVLNLSKLADLAFQSQIDNADGLLQALQTLAAEFNNNLYTKYCDPIIMEFVASVKALSEPQLASLSCANSMFANQSAPQTSSYKISAASSA